MTRWGFDIVRRSVPVSSLAKVCADHVAETQPIDFLKVDAESFEREVLEGADWERWRPVVVLVEDNGTHTWEPILLGAAYRFAAFDGINRYYLRDESADLLPRFAAPVNVLDDFVPHRYHRLHGMEDLRPASVRLARRLQRAADRHPTLSRVVRRLWH